MKNANVWNPERANALGAETDGLVSALGVSGTDPVILGLVDEWAEAHRSKDMAMIGLVCTKIQNRARALAAQHQDHERVIDN